MLLFKNNYSKIFCTEKVSIKREVGVLFYRSKGVKVVVLGLERFVAFTLPTHHCFFFVCHHSSSLRLRLRGPAEECHRGTPTRFYCECRRSSSMKTK